MAVVLRLMARWTPRMVAMVLGFVLVFMRVMNRSRTRLLSDFF